VDLPPVCIPLVRALVEHRNIGQGGSFPSARRVFPKIGRCLVPHAGACAAFTHCFRIRIHGALGSHCHGHQEHSWFCRPSSSCICSHRSSLAQSDAQRMHASRTFKHKNKHTRIHTQTHTLTCEFSPYPTHPSPSPAFSFFPRSFLFPRADPPQEKLSKEEDKYTDVFLMENYQYFWHAFSARGTPVHALQTHVVLPRGHFSKAYISSTRRRMTMTKKDKTLVFRRQCFSGRPRSCTCVASPSCHALGCITHAHPRTVHEKSEPQDQAQELFHRHQDAYVRWSLNYELPEVIKFWDLLEEVRVHSTLSCCCCCCCFCFLGACDRHQGPEVMTVCKE
jgi:hypothetical protein